jgi:tripartite-type tricarboxylate transporter receptor subunit TctC
VPTVKASGFDITIDSPMGLVAPKNLPPAIEAKLAAAFRKATADQAYQTQLDNFDMQHKLMTGEAYTAYARTAYERDVKMLKDIGFKLD